MPANSLADQIHEYVRAGFSGIWLRSDEQEAAIVEITSLCLREGWDVLLFDGNLGIQSYDKTDSRYKPTDPAKPMRDSLAAIRDWTRPAKIFKKGRVLICRQLHPLFNVQAGYGQGNRCEVLSVFHDAMALGKITNSLLVMLTASPTMPPELQKQFTLLEHPLPDRAQTIDVFKSLLPEQELPTGEDLEKCLSAAAGGTRSQIEEAAALSIIRHKKLDPTVIWELKTQMIRKTGRLSIYEGDEGFATLGGLEYLKQFCSRVISNSSSTDRNRRAKGVLLLGPPGTGKSAFAKALGVEMNRPTIIMDLGAQRAGLQGQTEANQREDMRIVDAIGKSILFVDELEKAMSGSGDMAGRTDGGSSARQLGYLLSWLNDHTSDVFFIGTCNDITVLPPEFSRAERFDALFFIDLPNPTERMAIWAMYAKLYGLAEQIRKMGPDDFPDDTNWTGAEIRTCCRLADLMQVSLKEASQNVVSIFNVANAQVTALRQWATGRCLSASRPGVYKLESSAEAAQAIDPRQQRSLL